MEKLDKNGHHEGCRCMGCGSHKHVWHWVVKLLILIIVFWVGFKLGELKILVEDNLFGPRMMYGSDYYGARGMMGSGWGGMMNGWGWANQSTTTRK